MKISLSVLLIAVLFSAVSKAQECNHLWTYQLSTDPNFHKYYAGDTTAGYAVLSFRPDPNLRLELKGKFPRGRFFSAETQKGKLFISVDALFDFQIKPDAGSVNPFLPGVSRSSQNRNFTINVSQKLDSTLPNPLMLATDSNSHSVMLRYYSPDEGVTVTAADLPSVRAYDIRTGKEISCPREAPYAEEFHFPQALADMYVKVKPGFEFFNPGDVAVAGTNKAASYMLAVTEVESDEVALVRFKAPTFNNTRNDNGVFHVGEETRYWSFCAVNFPNNETLVCLPDYLAKPEADGYQYIVVGKGKDVEKVAKLRGYSLVPDTRKPKQHVFGFVYRNLVPNDEFREKNMYRGEYAPIGQKCLIKHFLNGTCGW